MVTFRLADSLPRSAPAAAPAITTDADGRARLERVLDAGHGSCALAHSNVAGIVRSTLRRFDHERYRLIAWVVMPNHVHVLIETRSGVGLPEIVQRWKSYTSKAANRVLGQSGRFWQPEYFDRVIRDERHLVSAIEYIHNNPVTAGLVSRPGDWQFSSAAEASPAAGAGGSPALPATALLRSQDAVSKEVSCERR